MAESEMKERPEVGDTVDFLWRGKTRQGVITGVASTGVHFQIRLSEKVFDGTLDRYQRIPLSRITKVFKEVN